ncbi:Non-classical phosphatidylinositol transfer protein (PITP) [Elasticomyces elasticus]|nr:Non-classical phosphatidylinositol transfer protein (PITP) [Elasticomyces elasticus]KAK3625527.1 Non-classical phosphatidylinositol transfer protein (PITP) [Elasticomyces elasticus]KAK4920688.1 Non-classical phosphatidylinositol transfer protein (PITP) [Elasticomyces elasticus]KAK5746338.1 Non-classical phosphatidylinositol transfer protein (PITP) [Elasticomyces elasticus]
MQWMMGAMKALMSSDSVQKMTWMTYGSALQQYLGDEPSRDQRVIVSYTSPSVTPSSERHLRFLGAHQQVNELNSLKHLENLTGTVLLHREITTSTIVKISAVLRRCERSSGDVTELREIDNTIGNVFNADNWYMVEAFALALLDHEPPEQVPLPPLYKAKTYTYLSGHPDYPEDSNLLVARSWMDRAIKDAIAHVGFIPAEMQERQDMIEKHLALPVPPTPSDLSPEGLTLGGMDGTVDGTMESSSTVEVPHDKDKCKQCLYYRSLKAKKSMRVFAASRMLPSAGAPTLKQQEPVEEEDEAMADAKTEEGDERDERSMWNE